MRRGRFRADLYYRLCSDMIVAPSLEQRLLDTPEDLQHLVSFIAARLLGEQEAAGLTSEVQQWIERQLDPAYAWPGNVRELEQCVRNIMVRRSYDPSRAGPQAAIEALAGAVCAGTLTAEDLMRHYCSLVYARTGNYQETARRLGLDHRTIKSRIDESLVQQFRGQADPGRQ
jgi:transcriptional regulator with PAS, ATPase and Fis domain